MDVAKNLIEYRKQFKEKEAIFDKEVRCLRNQINDYVNKIQKKFLRFKNDFLGRLGTDDFYLTMRWGVEEDGVEVDYVSIIVGYNDNRTMPLCYVDVPLEKADEIETFEDLKQYADISFYPSFFESPSLNEQAMKDEQERDLQSLYEDLRMANYDFEYGDVKY